MKATKDNKSQGVDGIPPKLPMETVEQTSIPLARVFNLSLKEGVIPFEWKEANIIFKRVRKISQIITDQFNISDHMVNFFVRHNLVNPSQHGFIETRSCKCVFLRNH